MCVDVHALVCVCLWELDGMETLVGGGAIRSVEGSLVKLHFPAPPVEKWVKAAPAASC